MKRLIIAVALLASFGTNAAGKLTTVTNLGQCEGGYSGSITEVSNMRVKGGDETTILIRKDTGSDIKTLIDFDQPNSDIFGYVMLNDVNQTSVESAMLTPKGENMFNLVITSDINSRVTASIREYGQGVMHVYKCPDVKQTVAGI